MPEPKPFCIDGGPRHSWGRAALDVHNDRLVWVQHCIYCRKPKRRRYRGWRRNSQGRVTS